MSYKATPEKLREEFSKYGEIKECNILKREDGKMVGCAFIQYEKVNHAAKAIHHGNAKEFLGRPVVLDWAVNQKKFSEHLKKNKANKHPLKVEEDEDADSDDVSIKSEAESDDEDAVSSNADDSGDDSADDDDELEDSKVGIKPDPDAEDVKPKIRNKNDIIEGCTVFIKNIPFAATNDDLYKACRQFGKIKYALVTTDKVSGHSKGNGFVKFRVSHSFFEIYLAHFLSYLTLLRFTIGQAKESADMCLNSGTSFKLLDQILDPVPALSRNDINVKQESKKKNEPVDSRNLYLAKEGLIAANTPAAEGVSPSDISKRLFLEQSKHQLLKDLNRFVSMDRLTVHNIPPTFDDDRLRKAVEKTSKLKVIPCFCHHIDYYKIAKFNVPIILPAQPKECRIMRENKPSLGHPKGKSKGYAFVSFKTHKEALLCLRRLNNNPEAFGKNNVSINFSMFMILQLS